MLPARWQVCSSGTCDSELIGYVIEPLELHGFAHLSKADQKYVHFGLQLFRCSPKQKKHGIAP